MTSHGSHFIYKCILRHYLWFIIGQLLKYYRHVTDVTDLSRHVAILRQYRVDIASKSKKWYRSIINTTCCLFFNRVFVFQFFQVSDEPVYFSFVLLVLQFPFIQQHQSRYHYVVVAAVAVRFAHSQHKQFLWNSSWRRLSNPATRSSPLALGSSRAFSCLVSKFWRRRRNGHWCGSRYHLDVLLASNERPLARLLVVTLGSVEYMDLSKPQMRCTTKSW